MKIEEVRSRLSSHSKENGFVVVSLSLAAIIYFDISPANSTRNKMHFLKNYLEMLLLPTSELEWTLMGFEVKLEETLESRCSKCNQHILNIGNFNGNFYQFVKQLVENECGTSEKSLPKIQREAFKADLEKEKAIAYRMLIANIIVLANIDLTPHSHAVDKVMQQLSGTPKRVVGPGDYTTFDLYTNLLLWNRVQKSIRVRPPRKALLQSDFGCGKSLLLHAQIQACYENDPESMNFVVSFLQQNSTNRPFVRSVLDVANRLRYATH